MAHMISDLETTLSNLSINELVDFIKHASIVMDKKIAINHKTNVSIKESMSIIPSKKHDINPNPCSKASLNVSDIETYFTTSTRNDNDSANKRRERVLEVLSSPPMEYLEDPVYGNQWQHVHREWITILKHLADQTGISTYTTTKIVMKGGRCYNYDADVLYYDGLTLVGNRKIEFKNGGKCIDDLPQFLSLQTKFNLFEETYHKFWYDHYLDKYLECDTEIKEEKPSWQQYEKCVTSTKYNVLPFFAELKSRELFHQKEKNTVVNTSISEYLKTYGHTINLSAFSEKVKMTQTDKHYLLWNNGVFCLDSLDHTNMSDMVYHSIQNGNVLEIKAGNVIYGLLLRWRNHKGILNPAWQIRVKRCM